MAVKRKPGTRLLTGVEELDKKLAHLKLGANNKIARPALTKAARYLLKKVKAGIPPDKKDAKKAMGMVVDARGGASKNQQRAKVGAAVGKASKAAIKRGRKRPGVGMGAENIHWFILGTQQRSTGSKRASSKAAGFGARVLTGGVVRNTGIMPPQIPDAVKGPAQQERGAMLDIMRNEVETRLAAEAKK